MTEKTALEIAYERAQTARKRLQSDREKIEAWKRETHDPRYNESVESWMNKKEIKGHSGR